MRTTLIALVTAAALGACEDPAVSGLEGRWGGRIVCGSQTSELSMGLQVYGETLGGTAITRTREVDAHWEVSGVQEQLASTEPLVEGLPRTLSCRDDTCLTTADCADRGGGVCNEFGACTPCDDGTPWRRITLDLRDTDVQSIDPVLVLERIGDARMTGTALHFCPDSDLVRPHVEADKE